MRYSQQVMDNFLNPQNVGKIAGADAVGIAKNPYDSDIVEISFKIEKNRIKIVKFKTMGCVVAIAASSKLTEIIQGLTLKQALDINKQQLTTELNGLPDNKVRCSLTCIEAMEQALEHFQKS